MLDHYNPHNPCRPLRIPQPAHLRLRKPAKKELYAVPLKQIQQDEIGRAHV